LYTKGFCAAFFYLHFGFEILWLKNIVEKAARKMLVKLITGGKFNFFIHLLNSGSHFK